MNPIQVDHSFQQLQLRLRSAATYREKFRAIQQFLRLLDGHYQKYESYLFQLMEEFPVPAHPLNLTGCSPDWITTLRDRLVKMARSIDDLQGITEFEEMIDALNVQLAAHYLWLSDWESLLELLEGKSPESAELTVKNLRELSRQQQSVNASLRELQHFFESHRKNSARIIKNWIDFFGGLSNGVLVPVVDRTKNGIDRSGRLRHMKLSINADAQESDVLRSDFVVYGVEQTNDAIMDKAVAAMRRTVRRLQPGYADHHVEGQLFFELSIGMPQRPSANLAAAALFYIEYLRHLRQKSGYRFKSTTAVTGDLNTGGDVQEVNHETLCQIIEAAFFSWVRYLVVPANQKETARRCMARLNRKYPGKKLDLIGAEKLEDLLYERRITDYKHTNWIVHYVRRIWKKI